MRQNSLERNKTHPEGTDTQNKKMQTNKKTKQKQQQKGAKQQNTKLKVLAV